MTQANATSNSPVRNLLTFDLEDWYHCLTPEPARWSDYEDRITQAASATLDILQMAGTSATFFVLGHVAQRHPELILRILDASHEIASHGYDHRLIYHQSQDEFRRDVHRSISLLRALTGRRVLGYRAPYFSITRKSLWALRILLSAGAVPRNARPWSRRSSMPWLRSYP